MQAHNQFGENDLFGLFAELLARQTRALEQLTRPRVIVDVYPRSTVNALYFRIRNVGYTPAYDVNIHLEPPLLFRGIPSSELSVFQNGLAVLGPQDELAFFLDSALSLFNNEAAVLQFVATFRYSDAMGETYNEEVSVDMGLLRGLAIAISPAERMVDRLERIQKEIDKITRYTEYMRQRELMKEYLEEQQANEPVEAQRLEDE